jgi:MFS transporter, PPP family, 3-phenylpropionic acid transporter
MTPPLEQHPRIWLGDRLGFAGRLGCYYGCLFIVYGAAMPYLNVWLEGRGVSLAEIAIISAVSPLIRMLAGPVISFLADRQSAHRSVLIGLGWASFICWLLMSQAHAFWPALLAQALLAVTGAALIPLVETIAMAGVRTRGVDYGRMRLWGSATFVGASLAGGWLVDWRGIDAVISIMVLGALLTALSAHLLPRPDLDAGQGRPPLRVVDAIALVRTPLFLAFLLVVGLLQSAHATLNVFSVLHWRALGISNGWCGALWSIGVLAEIALFWGAAHHLRRWTATDLLLLGAVTSVVRWMVMGFDPPLAMLLPLQVLHGLTFGASHLGAIQFMAKAVPESHAGTGQGVYTLVTGGLFMAASTYASGIAFQALGGRAYWGMALLAVLALVVLWRLRQRWTGGVLALAAPR